jgi:hypothetical protein
MEMNMDPILVYLLNLILTLLAASLLTLLVKAALGNVLRDLCGTDERARFWTLFAMILLIAAPAVIGLGFSPLETGGRAQFFELMGRLRGNLLTWLFMLMAVGGVISVFSLFAPRPKPKDA